MCLLGDPLLGGVGPNQSGPSRSDLFEYDVSDLLRGVVALGAEVPVLVYGQPELRCTYSVWPVQHCPAAIGIVHAGLAHDGR